MHRNLSNASGMSSSQSSFRPKHLDLVPQLTDQELMGQDCISESDFGSENQQSSDKPIEKDLLRDMGLLNNRSTAHYQPHSQDQKELVSNFESEYQYEVKNEEHTFLEISYLKVREESEIEKLKRLPENTVLEVFLKKVRIKLKAISFFCRRIAENQFFELITLIIIISNTLQMATFDPLARKISPIGEAFEKFFLAFYIFETTIKIFSYGFIWRKGSYLRDLWNILDFIIVVTSVLTLFFDLGFSVNSLRAIRVLRPLRTITKIKALKMIVRTLFAAIPLVVDSIIMLAGVVFVYAILGTQIFCGVLKRNCINIETGVDLKFLCSNNLSCSQFGANYRCAKTIFSPNFSTENFDNIAWSISSVFQVITLEGWSTTMINLQNTSGATGFLFCISIIFICEMTLLNITLAILKNKFSQVKQRKIVDNDKQPDPYSIPTLKRLNMYSSISKLKSNMQSLSNYYGADANRKKTAAQNKRKATIKRKGIKSQKNSLFDRLKKIQTIQSLKSGQFQFQSERQMPSIMPSVKKLGTIKSIKSMKSLKSLKSIKQSQNKLTSNKLMKAGLPQYQISEIIYKGYNFQKQDEGIPEEVSQLSSFQQIQTQKAIQQGANLDLQKIQAVQRNKFLFSLLEANKQTHETPIQSSPLLDLQPPKLLISQPNHRIYQNMDLFRVANHHTICPLALKTFNGNKSYHPIAKIQKVRPSDFMTIKQENELGINDIKFVNDMAKKHLIIDLEDLSRQTSANHTKLTNQILPNKMNYKEVIELQPTIAPISYHLQSNEIEKHRLKDKIIRIPEVVRRVSVTNRIQNTVVAPSRKAFFAKKNIKNMLPLFKIKFKAAQTDTEQDSQIDNFQSAEEIDEYYFKKPKQELSRKQLQAAQIVMDEQDAVDNDLLYQQILLKKTGTNMKRYQSFLKQYLVNKTETVYMMCPGDDVMVMPTPSFSQDLLFPPPWNYNIWIPGMNGIFSIMRNRIKILLLTDFYDNFILSMVVFNTILLSLDGILDDSQNSLVLLFNQIFTIVFTIDIILKLIAYDFDFFQDIMNVFDFVVVVVSIADINQDRSNVAALQGVRLLRALRVLRVTRLIRALKFMTIITSIIVNILAEFVYIFLLLGLFILIYVLLGMQVFGKNTLPQSVTGIRQNFNSFFQAFITVFQVLTVQNWNDIATLIYTSSSNNANILYLITWIFIGNWVLLNLLQAILLQGFDIDQLQRQGIEYAPTTDQSEVLSQDPSSLTHQSNKLTRQLKTIRTTNSRQTNSSTPQGPNYSFGMFSPNNKFRVVCKLLVENKYFQYLVILLILLSCGKLIFDTYMNKNMPEFSWSSLLDDITTSAFFIEFLMRSIAHGFLFGRGVYLDDRWNKLDFVIAITGVVDLFLQVDLSVIRLLRVLRPLKLISKNPKVKVIVQSIGQSITGLANATLLLFLVFLVFGIFMINLLQGKLQYCDFGNGQTYGPYGIGELACLSLGYKWRTQVVNFDNIYQAMLSLYIFSTRQNWPYYFYTFCDAGDDGPVLNSNMILSLIISLLFIFICSYFLVDIFVGILFINFRLAEAKYNPKLLNQKQQNWMELQKLIIKKDPHLIIYIEPTNPIRKLVWKVVAHRWYKWITCVIVLLNLLCYGSIDDNMTRQVRLWIAFSVHSWFVLIYTIEVIAKFIAYGFKGYFLSFMNIIEFSATVTNWLEYGIDSEIMQIIPILFRIIRAFSLLRMLRQFKNLQRLMDTVIFALPSIVNIMIVLGLFLFVFSILGSYLFGEMTSDIYKALDPYRNFSNFHSSLQLLFICLTGQNWYYYMFATMSTETTCQNHFGETYSCGSPAAILFWFPFVFIGQKIILELFVLVVLDQFDKSYIQQNNPLGMYDAMAEDFTDRWMACSGDPLKKTIKPIEVIRLCLELKPPLGLGLNQSVQVLKAELQKSELNDLEKKKKLYDFMSKQRQAALKWVDGLELPRRDLPYHFVFYHFARFCLVAQFGETTAQQQRMLKDIEKISEQELRQKQDKINSDQLKQESKKSNLVQHIIHQMILNAWSRYTEIKHTKQVPAVQEQQTNSLYGSEVSDCEQAQLFQHMQPPKANKNRVSLTVEPRRSIRRSVDVNAFRTFEALLPNTDMYSIRGYFT